MPGSEPLGDHVERLIQSINHEIEPLSEALGEGQIAEIISSLQMAYYEAKVGCGVKARFIAYHALCPLVDAYEGPEKASWLLMLAQWKKHMDNPEVQARMRSN